MEAQEERLMRTLLTLLGTLFNRRNKVQCNTNMEPYFKLAKRFGI